MFGSAFTIQRRRYPIILIILGLIGVWLCLSYYYWVLDFSHRRHLVTFDAEPSPISTQKKSMSSNSSLEQCGLANLLESHIGVEPFLVFGVPTVPRTPEKGYLSRTLRSLDDQIPRKFQEKIKVVVVHNKKPGKLHSVFEQERNVRKDDKRFLFREEISNETIGNALEIETRDKPGPKVRQQTRDIVNTLRLAWNLLKPKFYVIMEDDFALCRDAVSAIAYMIDRATMMYGDWMVVRFSYGFNGVLLPGKDLLPLAHYLEVHQFRRPPDHLLVEWFVGETNESAAYKSSRIHGAFRYNILNHLGVYSTLREPKKTPYLGCWKEMRVPIVFEAEAYNRQCTRADKEECLSPCPRTPSKHCSWYQDQFRSA